MTLQVQKCAKMTHRTQESAILMIHVKKDAARWKRCTRQSAGGQHVERSRASMPSCGIRHSPPPASKHISVAPGSSV